MKAFPYHPLRLVVGLTLALTGLAHAQPTAPAVATLPASAVGATNATLKGIANPDGLAMTGWFEWGPTTNYGNITPGQALGSGTANMNFSQVVGGLLVGATYHYRAVASNSFYVVFGTNQSFSIPAFMNINAGLPGLFASSVAWGDYDNDGRLDLLLAGNDIFGTNSHVWRNTTTGFTNVFTFGLTVTSVSVAWADYDNDGLLDLAFGVASGSFGSGSLYRNTNGGFSQTGTYLGVDSGTVAWGDYDNDGRLDILAASIAGFGILQSCLWRNTGGGIFTNSLLFGVESYAAAWGDYDNDGRLDIFSGSSVLRNTGRGFTNINAGLPASSFTSCAWGDYDNDGRLDILLAGFNGSAICQVWRNTGSGFTNINAGLPGVYHGSVAWGDYDNDGRLDILLTGTTNGLVSGAIAQVWRNTGSGFTNINAGLPEVCFSAAIWGDYDNDGRLDIVLSGSNATAGAISQIWRNNTPLVNTPPTAPTGLAVTATGDTVTLSWNAASDAQTPVSGLGYNVRIGSTPGASDVMTAMSSASGIRRLPEMGNAQLGLTATFSYVIGTPYYWSVQAVDGGFAGSAFASERSFKLLPTSSAAVVPVDATTIVTGDINGDGLLDESELNTVLSNYFSTSPWLQMTNVAGLGGMNVTFALTNDLTGAFSVEYTTNLVNWQLLGPATPRYLFTDTNAPAIPQRYYRLRWP